MLMRMRQPQAIDRNGSHWHFGIRTWQHTFALGFRILTNEFASHKTHGNDTTHE